MYVVCTLHVSLLVRPVLSDHPAAASLPAPMDACMDECIDMYIDMCVDTSTDMRMVMSMDISTCDMRVKPRIDVGIAMCMD